MKIKIMAVLLVAAGAMLSLNGMRVENDKSKLQISNHSKNDIAIFIPQSGPQASKNTFYQKWLTSLRDSDKIDLQDDNSSVFVSGMRGSYYYLHAFGVGMIYDMNSNNRIAEIKSNDVLITYDHDNSIRLSSSNQ